MIPLKLENAVLADMSFRPRILAPMLEAAEAGQDLGGPLAEIVRSLGFTSFLYGLSTAARPGRDSLIYFYATSPREWSSLYEERAYIEVDPRIQNALDNSGPTPWDTETAVARAPVRQRERVMRFLDDASRYDIRSGVSWGLRNPENNGILLAFNTPDRAFGPARLRSLEANIGDILTFGTYFHEFFMRNFVEVGIPSRLRGAVLTDREVSMLAHVARGLTAEDIAHKFDITVRTVRHHVDSARTKMGALNREEAVAIAAKAGLINVVP